MTLKITQKPKSPTIIVGFPGFGLVGTITTEFLIDHLKTKQIGRVFMDGMPAVIAIHGGQVVEPIGLFYNKTYNILIVHAVNSAAGSEWKITEEIVELAKKLKAKEIISLEGVGGGGEGQSKTFYYASNDKNAKRLEGVGVKKLQEGIIMGVTGSILLKAEKIPSTCVFAETETNLPDSKAAAKIIEILDKYLGLNVDYKPLMQQAEKFEKKLRGILEKSKQMTDLSEKKRLSYVG